MDLVGRDHYAIFMTDLQCSADGYGHVMGGLFLRPDAEPAPDTARAIKHVAFLVDGDTFAAVHEELTRKGIDVQGPEGTGAGHSAASPVVSSEAVPVGSHAR